MDRPGSESAEDNLLKPGEHNNLHSDDNVEAGLAVTGDNHKQNSLNPCMETEGDESAESDSDSSDDEHHEFPPDSLRGKLHPIMKSNLVQYTIIALVIADCLIIVVELLIDMEIIVFPENEPQNATDVHNTSHPIAYSPNSFNHSNHHDHHHWLVHGAHYLFMNKSSSNHTDGDHSELEHHHHTNKEKAQHVLHMLSLAILSVFMVEVCIKIYVEREHLLKQKAEVFDAIVVIISFTLDVIFTFVSVSSVASDAAGLMVLLRLWRVTRIINGVVMSVKHDAKMKMAVQKKISRKLERENRKLRSKIEKLERDNATLRKQLRQSQASSLEVCDSKSGGCKRESGCTRENEAIEMQELGGKT